MKGVDNPDAPPGVTPLDRLSVQQVGIHTRLLINEPCLEVRNRVLGVFLFLRSEIGGGQCTDDLAELNQRPPVSDEVVVIRLTVSADVGAIRCLWIGPPVVSL